MQKLGGGCLRSVVEVAGHDEGAVLPISGEEIGGVGTDSGCFSRPAVEGLDGEAGPLVFVPRAEATTREGQQLGLQVTGDDVQRGAVALLDTDP